MPHLDVERESQVCAYAGWRSRARGPESQSVRHNRIINRIKAANSMFAATIERRYSQTKWPAIHHWQWTHAALLSAQFTLAGSNKHIQFTLPIQMRASICPAANWPNRPTDRRIDSVSGARLPSQNSEGISVQFTLSLSLDQIRFCESWIQWQNYLPHKWNSMKILCMMWYLQGVSKAIVLFKSMRF